MSDSAPKAAEPKPSLAVSAAIFVLAVGGMAGLALHLFHDRFITLSYALPLLICLWHRDRRLLWALAAAFAIMSACKVAWLIPDPDPTDNEELLQWLMELANILAVAIAVQVILNLTDRLRRKNQMLQAANEELTARQEEIHQQNEELQAQREELAQQNEELQRQGEELTQQNEEMQQQSEELQAQSEELHQANRELNQRETMLETILSSFREVRNEQEVVGRICHTLVHLVGEPAAAAAVVESNGNELLVRAHAGAEKLGVERLPLAGSFAAFVMQFNRTAFVDDLTARPDLRVPQPPGRVFRSVLATPLRLRGKPVGAVKIYSLQPQQWTSEHFRILEWVAAQCALALEAVRLQEELRHNQERLAMVLEKTGVGLWLNQWPLTSLNWDKRTRELFFVPPGVEPTLELFLKRLHPDDREPTRLAIDAAVRDHTLYTVDYRVIHPTTGELRWLHSSGRAAYGADGTPLRFDGMSYDITDRKAFETELERQVAARTSSLEETTKQLNDFCYSVAHDLKAPIRAQLAFAHTLVEEFGQNLGKTGREYAQRIADAAERQGNLVRDLLAHISVGRAELPMEPVELAAVIQQVQQDLQVELREKQATIRCEQLNARVIGNPASLHLVLSNLLSNALKFVPRETLPQVRVWCEPLSPAAAPQPPQDLPARLRASPAAAVSSLPPRSVRLWVEDNGIGIPEKYHSKLFHVFERLHTRDQYPGTGIGLAIVKRAVERMGGRVGLESEPGKGSRFWVELPNADSGVRSL